jgi:tRNA threonylcarbamoyladenosine biosynthesis protein TsaB
METQPAMIILALDTSEARGSVAVLRDGSLVSCRAHADQSDYSAWLLPAVYHALAEANTTMEQVQLFAVSTGPGSFTGLRVGLTTVKAWAEVYGKPVVGVSRLLALARSAETATPFVASCYDAQRGQLFAGLYRACHSGFDKVGDEVVASPEEFLQLVDGTAAAQRVTWLSLDPQLIRNLAPFQARIDSGDLLLPASPELAPILGKIAAEQARSGVFSDPLTLDADYVRRSDAEIFWKGSSSVR